MVKLFSDFLEHCLEFVKRAQDLGLNMNQINLVNRMIRNLTFDDRPGVYESLNNYLDQKYNDLDDDSEMPAPTHVLYDVIDLVGEEIERSNLARRNAALNSRRSSSAASNGTPPPGKLQRSVSLLPESRNTSLTGSTQSLTSSPRHTRRSFTPNPVAMDARDLERKRNLRLRMSQVDTNMTEEQFESLLMRPLVEPGDVTERCHMCNDVITAKDEMASLPCGHQLDRKCLESRVKSTAECPFCLRIV